MPLTWNIAHNLIPVGQTHLGDFTQSGVRLFRRNGINACADAALLRASLQRGDLVPLCGRLTAVRDQLVDGRHAPFPILVLFSQTAPDGYCHDIRSNRHAAEPPAFPTFRKGNSQSHSLFFPACGLGIPFALRGKRHHMRFFNLQRPFIAYEGSQSRGRGTYEGISTKSSLSAGNRRFRGNLLSGIGWTNHLSSSECQEDR
ncbi:hypothetical protein GMO_22690 [Gluconobacter morbifer G707]|uniref:Uncharacterized protein n=1 Tax=Gluconobacter morbifer G707 TaxID=1088869 RepID=G6XLM0_9PROT|nr:hypothetical protein GMO_22690 [Gluconobacter morbifer G707]